jgi:ribosomal protein L9
MERRFRITVRGQLGERFGEIFGSVDTEIIGDHTRVAGRAIDQANLDGILAYLRNLGIELISLETWEDVASFEEQTGEMPSPSTQESE